MAKKLKTYNVEVKALKTAPEVKLRLDFLKKGEKIYELAKLLESNLRIMLTDSKYQMSQLFIEDYKTRASFPTGDYATNRLTTMRSMFNYCQNLTSLDLSNFDTNKVTNMCNMFNNCTNLTSLDLSNFNTNNVTDMKYMFNGCKNLTEIKGIIDMKSCVSSSYMFVNCNKLSGVKIKNPPEGFTNHNADTGLNNVGLRADQYEIVE